MLRRGGSSPLRPTIFGRLAESSLKHLGANETGQECPTGEQSPHLPPFSAGCQSLVYRADLESLWGLQNPPMVRIHYQPPF